jgi:hypothetical protein
MSYWLAHVLRSERERAKISRNAIVRILNVDPSTVFRLEVGQTLPHDVDRYVAAYAKALKLEDGRELWHQALRTWMTEGAPPVLSEELEAAPETQLLQREIREAEMRERAKAERQERDSGAGKRGATRKRRAAG